MQIVPSAKGIKGAITNELGGEAESAGTSAGKSFGSNLISTVKGIIAAAGIGKMIGDAINQGAEFEQNLGGTEAVFGKFAKNVQDSATTAYKNMGMSASEYMATANKMGSLFQGSGMEQEKALNLTTQAMQRAADVASVMGIDTSAAMEAIAGAAKNNFTMMDNLGVAMNATSIEAYALQKGLNFKWNTATEAQKAEVAMQMFFERTSQYAGNFKRESNETFSGSFNALKSSWENVLAALTTGSGLETALAGMSGSITAFAENAAKMLGNLFGQIPDFLMNTLDKIAPQMGPLAADTISKFIDGAIAMVPKLAVIAVEMIGQLANGLTNNLPKIVEKAMEIAAVIPETIIKILPKLAEVAVSIINNLTKGLSGKMPDVIGKATEIITSLVNTLVNNLPQILQAGVQLIVSLVEGIVQHIPHLIAAVPQIIDALLSGLSTALPAMMSAGWDLINGIAQGIINGLGSVIKAAIEAGKSIFNSVKQFFRIGSPSKLMNQEIGRNIMLGFAEGIEGNEKAVRSALSDVNGMVVEGMNIKANATMSGADVSGADIVSAIKQGFENVKLPVYLDSREIRAGQRKLTRVMGAY